MHWTERRKAKANLGLALRARGWTLYGFHEDRSDPMTDYWAPASWDGVAEKRGYVVVVDVSAGSSLLKRSGGRSTAKQPQGDDCDHGEVTLTWPSFQACPIHRLWHVEKDGRILDSGVGLGPCADWDRERATAAVERIVNRIEASIARNEGQPAATTTDSRPTGDGVTIRRNLERQGIEVVFPDKPGEEVRAGLKRLGFRWSRRQGLWYARFSASLWSQVHDLLAVGDEEEPAPGLDREPLEAIETPSPALDQAEPTLTTPSPGHRFTLSTVEAPLWAMSRRAYQESRALRAGGVPILNARDGREHESAVRQAVAEGLPVPAHVLAEYGLVDDVPASGQTPSTAPEPLQLALFAPS